MPELPEVEVTAQHLAAAVQGARLVSAHFSGKRLRHPFPRQAMASLTGQRLRQVGRRAKYLLLEFDPGWVAVHLGMSGVMQCCDPATAARLHDHVRLSFRSDSGDAIDVVFHDPRRFGSFQWIGRADLGNDQDLGELLGESARGLEPFDSAFDGDFLYQQSRGKTTPIKHWLMAGQTVVGVGNIYACEALFESGIHPGRAAGSIAKPRYQSLAAAIRRILAAAIASGGSTISDFLGPDGQAGRYGQSHRVYDHEGAPCPRCASMGNPRAKIRRMVQQQRSTFYCCVCQR